MASMMSLAIFLISSVRAIDVLQATGVGVFLGTEEVTERVVVGYRPEGSKTVELTY